MNLHLTARPIWLTRHGESVYNVQGVLGGDPDLTPDRRRYAQSLARFLGESYHDIILRLDPLIIELERTRKPVLVIAHNAVLRALYAYFQGVPRERCPYLPIPLHTVIEVTPHAYGCHEQRVALEPPLRASEAPKGTISAPETSRAPTCRPAPARPRRRPP